VADVLSLTAKDQFERERVIKALQSARGDKDEAAKILGVGRSTLFRKIKELGIE
jgi:transcriptional regulator of acetoin/glycerol metabolism